MVRVLFVGELRVQIPKAWHLTCFSSSEGRLAANFAVCLLLSPLWAKVPLPPEMQRVKEVQNTCGRLCIDAYKEFNHMLRMLFL